MSTNNFKKWFLELANQEYKGNTKKLQSQIHTFERFIATKTNTAHTTPDNVFDYLGVARVS